MDQGNNSTADDKEDQEDPTANNVDQNQNGTSSKSDQSNELQKTGTIIVRNCFLFSILYHM